MYRDDYYQDEENGASSSSSPPFIPPPLERGTSGFNDMDEYAAELARLRHYLASHNFVSIMNDPRQTSEWGDWAWEVLWPTSSGSSITYEDTPPVVISNPPIHVDLNTFQPYIQSVEEPLRKHQELERIRKAEERDAAKRQAEMLAEEAALSGNSSALPSTSAATSASGAPVLLLSDAQTYRNMALKDYRECKKVVPPVFFRDDFALEDRDVFLEVFGPNPATSSLLLNEKLSHYLDEVEVHLVRQVSLRSESFFQALSTFQSLQAEVSAACAHIDRLRLRTMDLKNHAAGNMRVLRLLRQRSSMLALYKKTKLIEQVRQAVGTLELLSSSSVDFDQALDLIESTQNTMDTQLAGIQCLKLVGQQLEDIRANLRRTLQSEFIRVVSQVVEQSSVSTADIQQEVLSLLSGLHRLDHIVSALDAYREDVQRVVKKTAKEAVESCLELLSSELSLNHSSSSSSLQSPMGPNSRAQEAAGTLASVLKSLSPQQFHFLLSSLFDALVLVLQRAQQSKQFISSCLHQLLLSPSSSASAPSESPIIQPKQSSAATASLLERCEAELSDLLHSSCELAHARCARVLAVRDAESIRLSAKDCSDLLQLSQRFIERSEALCSRSCASLRGILVNQARSYVDTFHKNKMTQLALLLDNESWVPADVPSEFQSVVRFLIQDSSHDVSSPDLLPSSSAISPSEDSPSSNLSPFAPSSSSALVTRGLEVAGRLYPVSSSVLMLVKMLSDYVFCGKNIPFSTEIIIRRIFDLLQLFNSRTCQLVLGAGALHIAGLKSITAKHLALSSQCLSFLVAILPGLRSRLAEGLTSKQQIFLADLDRFNNDCLEHRKEIYSKIVSIMAERVEAHCKSLQSFPWDDERAAVPSPHSQGMVKEIGVLLKVLNQFLFPEQIKSVFSQVLLLYNKKLSDFFAKFDCGPQAKSKRRLYEDLQFIRTQFSSNFKDIAGDLATSGLDAKYLDIRLIGAPSAPVVYAAASTGNGESEKSSLSKPSPSGDDQ